jgi:hypothetical protein
VQVMQIDRVGLWALGVDKHTCSNEEIVRLPSDVGSVPFRNLAATS